MTTEEKALALANAAKQDSERTIPPFACGLPTMYKALLAAIEAHEADNARNEQRLADQAKAFSDAMLVVQEYITGPSWDRGDRCEYIELAGGRRVQFADFILPEPEPDPLVEAVNEAWGWRNPHPDVTKNLRQALAARGYKIERIEK